MARCLAQMLYVVPEQAAVWRNITGWQDISQNIVQMKAFLLDTFKAVVEQNQSAMLKACAASREVFNGELSTQICLAQIVSLLQKLAE